MGTGTIPSIELSRLRPYVSVVLLECTSANPVVEIARLPDLLAKLARERKGTVRTSAPVDVPNIQEVFANSSIDAEDLSSITINGYVVRLESDPGWQIDGPYRNVEHSLTLIASYQRFVAISCDSGTDRIQSWLDKAPTPPYKRLDSRILEEAFLKGDAKSLWLDGVNAPRSSKASSKHLSGPQLQQALNPLDDPGFSLSAGRADISSAQAAAVGVSKIGTTPKNSTVWLKPARDINDFVASVIWALKTAIAVIDATAGGPAPAPVFPWLATKVADLTGVVGAFHMTVPLPEDVPPNEQDPDLIQALTLLENAELIVRAGLGASCTLDVGLAGSIAGTLATSVTMAGSRPRIRFGWHGTPTNLPSARPVLDALVVASRLIRIHYSSGHSVDAKGVWLSNAEVAPFHGWSWQAFNGFDVSMEKPLVAKGVRIHDQIGISGDPSLFGWVVARFSTGYLTCDDGSGEVADFVHLDHDDTLSVVHVKSANAVQPTRSVAVQRYEGVIGQAVKNLAYLRGSSLADALDVPSRKHSATWLDGSRVADRGDFVEHLRLRSQAAATRVIVLQPQVTKLAYGHASNVHKVRLLDTLLHSARASAVGLGADLEVWSSK